ncbi:HNH endonuclease [Streptomyces tateyamensis]|uniref:HNH endonuclease n=1 Tax=Streptomyces tateyamensis TaxID=565073 RepID=A0A2V4N6L3_9ACTN|nr:HNH endonuclease [Streptomyces tateyamensis]
MALGEDRQHGGNEGYDDEPSRHYSWDSTVPNHSRLAAGDVLALWDAKTLLGVSVIEDIIVSETVKPVYSCPICRKADFYPRKREHPAYVCRKCGATFDEPAKRNKQVTTYRSSHAMSWVDMTGVLSAQELRALCDSPKSQLSLRSLRWEKLRAAITGANTATTVGIADAARAAIAGGHRPAIVRVRVGQAAFRRRLLNDMGEICAFTGPAPAAALDAAHLYSYAINGKHDEHGGLLMRRDIHRLFDLGHITVNPESLTLDISEQLHPYPLYSALQGAALTVPILKGHRNWLQAHWHLHRTT